MPHCCNLSLLHSSFFQKAQQKAHFPSHTELWEGAALWALQDAATHCLILASSLGATTGPVSRKATFREVKLLVPSHTAVSIIANAHSANPILWTRCTPVSCFLSTRIWKNWKQDKQCWSITTERDHYSLWIEISQISQQTLIQQIWQKYSRYISVSGTSHFTNGPTDKSCFCLDDDNFTLQSEHWPHLNNLQHIQPMLTYLKCGQNCNSKPATGVFMG